MRRHSVIYFTLRSSVYNTELCAAVSGCAGAGGGNSHLFIFANARWCSLVLHYGACHGDSGPVQPFCHAPTEWLTCKQQSSMNNVEDKIICGLTKCSGTQTQLMKRTNKYVKFFLNKCFTIWYRAYTQIKFSSPQQVRSKFSSRYDYD